MSNLTHLTSSQIKYLQQQLQAEQQLLYEKLNENDHMGLNESMRDNLNELSTIDNHPADIGSEMFEREKDIALNEHEELRLMRIEDALERIKHQQYGKCATCGAQINYERLEAIPETAYCKEHSPQAHLSLNRPIEETLLDPPFGRTSMDEHEYSGFDGEDAWQIVESYGTSTSPAYAEQSEVTSYDDLTIEENEEFDGFVEPFESYVATDIYGNDRYFFRNQQYTEHMKETKHLRTEDDVIK